MWSRIETQNWPYDEYILLSILFTCLCTLKFIRFFKIMLKVQVWGLGPWPSHLSTFTWWHTSWIQHINFLILIHCLTKQSEWGNYQILDKFPAYCLWRKTLAPMKCPAWSQTLPVRTAYDFKWPNGVTYFIKILSMLICLSLCERKINPHRGQDSSMGKGRCISLPELP